MPELLQILVIALLPPAGNFAGGMLAEIVKTTPARLSLALHAAAGIVLGVIAIELAPRAFEGMPVWGASLAFLAGGGAFLLLEAVVEKLTRTRPDSDDPVPLRANAKRVGPWIIYAAVAIDLFSDGLLVGAGSSLSFGLALLLAIGQVTADIPEGFAAVANFKAKGIPRAQRILLAASFAIPMVVAALLSFLVLRDLPEVYQLGALAFIAGLLLVAATEEIVGEAHEADCDTRASVLAIAGGFALFGLVSGYFGG